MTNVSRQLDVHRERERDLVRASRRHALADVHPLERRSPLTRLRALVFPELRPPELHLPPRTFPIARSS